MLPTSRDRGSLLTYPVDWHRMSDRKLYRIGFWTLLIVGIPTFWVLARREIVPDAAWAAAFFLILMTQLRLWYLSTRRERVLLMAFTEMSDLHVGYLRALRESYEADQDDLWLIKEAEPEAFWEDLVQQRLLEIYSLGVRPLEDEEIALTLHTGSRYQF